MPAHYNPWITRVFRLMDGPDQTSELQACILKFGSVDKNITYFKRNIIQDFTREKKGWCKVNVNGGYQKIYNY